MTLSHAPFPLLDLSFEMEFEEPWKLPPFPGGLLRGAFGSSLRALSCMTGFRSCIGCPLRETCPFPALFEPPPRDLTVAGLSRAHEGLPPPFILRVPETDVGADGRLVFGMRLVGPAIARLAFVIEAWRRALARGLGRDRVRGTLLRVVAEPRAVPVWEGEEICWPELGAPPLVRAGPRVALVSRSPMRLQSQGQRAPQSGLSPRLLVSAIVRRARLLAAQCEADAQAAVREWPVGDWLEAADGVAHEKALVWRDWYRFSSRQQRRMNLGGYVGQWRWDRVPDELQGLLALGTLIHVGKEASFGLGAFEVLPA
jgi:hypothetical protein